MRNELILEFSDLDVVSIQCESCDTRLLVSLLAINRARTLETKEKSPKPATVPKQCPSCGDDWQAIQAGLEKLDKTRKSLEGFKVTFHIQEPVATNGE